jgi:hypothetical protein
MKHNLNIIETLIRLALTMFLVIGGWLLGTFLLFPVGMFITVTALSGYCPVYHVLGVDRSSHGGI